MTQELQKPTIFNHGNIYTFGNDNPLARLPKIPIGTYLVQMSMEMGFYLEKIPNFDIPKKLYGDIGAKAARILNTFKDRPKTTGVLLSGEKGSGKTLLTKVISTFGQEVGYPTIVVNNPYRGDAFNTFIQNIEQPCIVLFDEFEKVYDSDEQQGLLTLFDGVFSTKKLLLLTTNQYMGINTHLQNRPGRLYYLLEFKGLDNDFIMEYGEEHLKNKKFLSTLGIIASIVKPISFDILQAIIEESNRYNESPIKALDMLNVKGEQGYQEKFLVSVKLLNGKTLGQLGDDEDDKDYEVFCNPFKSFYVELYYKSKVKSGKNKGKETMDYERILVNPNDLIGFNGVTGVYDFVVPKVGEVTLKRKPVDDRTTFTKYEHLLVD